MQTKFKEVDYIDGNTEFTIASLQTELLPQNENIFVLGELAHIDSVLFSGDTSLFQTQVYKKEDLDRVGAYFIENKNNQTTIRIREDLKTASYTYTYVSYKEKVVKKQPFLFSVDYSKSIAYFSTPVNNLEITYKAFDLIYEGQEMTQGAADSYTIDSELKIKPTSSKVYTYQTEVDSRQHRTNEYFETPILNTVILRGNNE